MKCISTNVVFQIDKLHCGEFFWPLKLQVLATARGQLTSTDGLEMCYSTSYILRWFIANIEIAC